MKFQFPFYRIQMELLNHHVSLIHWTQNRNKTNCAAWKCSNLTTHFHVKSAHMWISFSCMINVWTFQEINSNAFKNIFFFGWWCCCTIFLIVLLFVWVIFLVYFVSQINWSDFHQNHAHKFLQMIFVAHMLRSQNRI